MVNTAALQNNVRLRVFLILVIAIVIRTTRHSANESIHKVSDLLEINYVLYGIILVTSLMPFKSAWGLTLIASLAATTIGILVIVLGGISTFGCLGNLAKELYNIYYKLFVDYDEQNDPLLEDKDTLKYICVVTAPGSMITLVLVGINILLNVLQSWTILSIIKSPTFVSSAAKRLRILFAWALPFAWLINGVLIYESKWQPLVALHLAADPTIILLATSKENILLAILVLAVIICDVLVYFFFASVDIVKTAVLVQIGLSTVGFFMLFVMNENNSDSDQGGSDGAKSTEEPDMDFEQNLKIRKRKTNIKDKSDVVIKF